jgi:hypothetical protein
MATDIFSRTVGFGGAFSADGAMITFGATSAGMLAQSVQWSYMQAVQRIYEIGSNNVFLIAGRTQGQASIQRVMGPTALATAFYATFGNVCNATSNNINFTAQARCGSAGWQSTGDYGPGSAGAGINIGLYNCVIQSYGGGIQAQEMVVNEQIQMLFLYLVYG